MSTTIPNADTAAVPARIGCDALPVCGDHARRVRLREGHTLNGIDYIEVGPDQRTLCVHLFGEIPAGLAIANVRVRGGRRIRGLRVLEVDIDDAGDMHDDACLRVVLDRAGDHSAYCLCLVDAQSPQDPPDAWRALDGFDPRYACAEFRVRLDCGEQPDCIAPAAPCNEREPAPAIDYLAKDYASFRKLMFDRLAQTMPQWRERHVPDIGVALVELLAYRADRLSYFQDAVATEAYLETARRRISVRRHARLVDYRMHEGCNARALIAIESDNDITLAIDDVCFAVPPPDEAVAVPAIVDVKRLDEARARGALVFEPISLDAAASIRIVAAHSTIRIHTWGDELCCLPRGSTRATLVDAPWDAAPPPVIEQPAYQGESKGAPTANVPQTPRVLKLRVGDLLIFEEARGSQTGNPADADPAHRHAVRITRAQPGVDALYGTHIVEIEWDACDALPFDLCLSARLPAPDCARVHDISVVRGNVVLVDHGESLRGECDCAELCAPASDAVTAGVARALAAMPDACERCSELGEECWLVPGSAQYGCCSCDGAVLDERTYAGARTHGLRGTPVTFAVPVRIDAPVCHLLPQDPRDALPQLAVYGGPLEEILVAHTPDERWRWHARYDLLASAPDDRHFVAEIDDDGAAQLRFGDGTLGRAPQAGEFFRARVRVGNGSVGNVGRDSIVWLIRKSGSLSGIQLRPRNPLPAQGGTAPETLAEAKLYAPGAFRAQIARAITADDYAEIARRTPGQQGAGCALEWTGSWYEANVVVDPLGSETLDAALARKVAGALHRYRRIGHDVAVEAARYVPLTIVVKVCVLPDFLKAHVEAELRNRFTAGLRGDGLPGFFHPDRLHLGEAVYASRIVAEAQAVVGVAHAEIATLARMDALVTDDAIATGVLPMAVREIAQVDGDPDYSEHGNITFVMGGGR
jgi:hypothetical protein